MSAMGVRIRGTGMPAYFHPCYQCLEKCARMAEDKSSSFESNYTRASSKGKVELEPKKELFAPIICQFLELLLDSYLGVLYPWKLKMRI